MAGRKIVFIDRVGTLVEAPADGPLVRVEDVRLMPDVISALSRLRDAGFELVVVSNEPGLGTSSYPREAFDLVDGFVRALFASQGIEFADVLICPHEPDEDCACRKPGVGLVRAYLQGNTLDRGSSAVLGNGATDLELAANMGLAGYLVKQAGSETETWAQVAHALVDRPRVARVERNTRETQIVVDVDLDSRAAPRIATGIGFFDHMLEQLGKHGGFALCIACNGDLEVDEHHTIEDVALSLGEALARALGDKRGIQRYGFTLPMDEALADVAVDLGGRAYLVFEGTFPRDVVGGMPTELVPHFFRSLADTLGASLRISVRGDNAHHMVEACFKAVARALRQAIERRGDDLPSTKGIL